MPKEEPSDSQAVLAYRVTQLEKTSAEGFRLLNEKLDQMSHNFATHQDVAHAVEMGEIDHKAIYEKISDVERDVTALKRKNWVQNTLSAILGAVITLLVAFAFNSIIGGK